MVIWVLTHLPHLLPPVVAFAFLARLAVWAAQQPPSHYIDEQVEQWNREHAAARRLRNAPVRRRTAAIGLFAITPIALAFVTGLWIYTLSLRGDASPAWLIWSHSVISVVALVLVTIKSGELGWRRILGRMRARRPQDAIASVTMLAFGVPIALTGVLMLLRPSGGDFTIVDYLHVITGVWWAVIVQWHLYRYFGRAMRAVSAGAATADVDAST
ncbi:MAG: hypothetical protein NTX95_03970 [Actinobacteria bacterium]|nr:hypothetical protein [Actinomycetota bacterium]